MAVRSAEDALALQQAMFAKAKAGASPEDITVAESAVAVAQAGVKSAQGALANAQANLAKLEHGPTERDIHIVEQRVDQAKNNLWSAQTERDGIGGRVEAGFAGQ